KHEKGHYIISIIKQYWLQDTLKSLRLTEKNYKQELRNLQKYIEQKAEALNQAYDKETNHSTIAEQQVLWEKKLLDDLTSLSNGNTNFPFVIKTQLVIPKK